MKVSIRFPPIRAVLLAGALLTALANPLPAGAATQITTPMPNAQDCGGTVLIDVTTMREPAPSFLTGRRGWGTNAPTERPTGWSPTPGKRRSRSCCRAGSASRTRS